MTRRIFISYSHRDRQFVEKFYKRVRKQIPLLWLDQIEMKAGDSLPIKVRSAIEASDYVVVILSPSSVSSRWVRFELEHAISKGIQYDRNFLIPILYKRCTIPAYLQGKLYIDFTNPKEFDKTIQQFLNSIEMKDFRGSSRFKEPLPFPGKTFKEVFQQLALETGDGGKSYFQMLATMPLSDRFAKSIRYRSFGGDFKSEVFDFIGLFSNLAGALQFNNLMIFLGFLHDMNLTKNVDADWSPWILMIVFRVH